MVNEISFPSLNLNFKISRIAFRIFNIPIYWYAIIIVSGIIIALLLCKKSKTKFGIEFDNILEALIFALPIGVICARIYYCIFNLPQYVANPQTVLNIKDGGLAIYGGIIGAGITIVIYCKLKKIDILNFFDCIIPYVAIAQSIGRWGNFVNVEAYGYETTNFFRMQINTIEGIKEVHPTFLYESIVMLGIFILLEFLKKRRKFKGEIIEIYFITYSFARFWIEGIRADSLMLYKFRISQILSIFIFVFFCFNFIFKILKDNKLFIKRK